MANHSQALRLIMSEWTRKGEFVARWEEKMKPEMLAAWAEELNELRESYKALGGTEWLPHLGPDCMQMQTPMDEATAENIRNAY